MSTTLRRPVALAVTAVTALTFLTGCVRAETGATITPENTVSGSMAFGFNKTVLESMGMSPDALISQSDDAMSDEFKDKPWADSVKTSEWKKDGFAGTQISFEGVPLEEFNKTILPTLDLYSQDGETTSSETTFSFSSEDNLDPVAETETSTETEAAQPDPKYPPVQVERVDDTFQISGVIDFSKERAEEMSQEEGSSDMGVSDEQSEEMAAGGGAELSLTFPGPVTSETGKVEDNTVTWDVALGDRSEITATASAVAGEAVAAPDGENESADAAEKSASNWVGLVAMLVGLLLLAGAGVAGFVFWRERRDTADDTGVDEFEPVPSTEAPVFEPAVADDYTVDLDAPVQEPYAEPAAETFINQPAEPAAAQSEDAEAQGRRRAAVPVDSEPTVPAAVPQRVEPGWYPTADGTHLRWHDGTSWTEHLHVVE